jgi:cyclohexanecarboxyl-CoA dehydrogenase
MDFSLSPDQQSFQQAARRFAIERLSPGYRERERSGMFDRALVREMGALGLLGPGLPEEFGGLGLDAVTVGLLIEQVGWGDINMAYLPLLTTLNGEILLRHAQPEVAREWLPAMCRGEKLCALALTEPQTGSDAAHIRLKARRDGAVFRLEGEKTSISMALAADAAVVFARTGEEPGAHGVSAFLVPLDGPGVSRTRIEDMGSVAVGRGSLFFDGAAVPASHLLGGEGKGFVQVMQGFDFSRALIGLQCLGPAQASLEETWRYVRERTAFNHPLVYFEGVSFPLAEAETKVLAARTLCYRALWLKDRGEPHTAEAAMCKWWAPLVAYEAIHQCLLLHGHAGYSKDTPHQQRLRDVLGLQIGDGTAQIMKLIIARERAGRAAVPY